MNTKEKSRQKDAKIIFLGALGTIILSVLWVFLFSKEDMRTITLLCAPSFGSVVFLFLIIGLREIFTNEKMNLQNNKRTVFLACLIYTAFTTVIIIAFQTFSQMKTVTAWDQMMKDGAPVITMICFTGIVMSLLCWFGGLKRWRIKEKKLSPKKVL